MKPLQPKLSPKQKQVGEVMHLRFPSPVYAAIKRASLKENRNAQNFVHNVVIESLRARGEMK